MAKVIIENLERDGKKWNVFEEDNFTLSIKTIDEKETGKFNEVYFQGDRAYYLGERDGVLFKLEFADNKNSIMTAAIGTDNIRPVTPASSKPATKAIMDTTGETPTTFFTTRG